MVSVIDDIPCRENNPMQPNHSGSDSPERTTDPLLARVVRTSERHNMLAAGDRVLVGVSGGADSVALLDILSRLAPTFKLSLAIAHLDHGLRPAAAPLEADLVRRMAERMGIDCYADKISLHPGQGSLEEQLRLLRYAFFERAAAAAGCNKIAVGHHADDNAEAVLLNMLRGSGLRGLAGIPAVRDSRIIRPLIEIRRKDIVGYVQRHRLPYLEDASNTDPRYARNKIRHHLIPLLQREYNPNVVPTLNRLATLCAEEDAWLDTQLAPLSAESVASCPSKPSSTGFELDAKTLTTQPRPVQRRVIRKALEQWQGNLRRIGALHIEALMELLRSGETGGSLDLPNHLKAERSPAGLRFYRSTTVHRGRPLQQSPAPSYSYNLPAVDRTPVTVEIPEADCALLFSVISPAATVSMPLSERHMVFLDFDQLCFPLTIRNFLPGDRLRPFGMQGSQKLKTLFINRRVAPEQRRRLPLLVSGGTIVWVAGVRRADIAPVSPDTSRILKVEILERISL
jgi:tRNA(Ile)-lysidine synthase